MSGWREDLDAVDAALIDGYQSGFPTEPRPFRAVGRAIGVGEDDALERVRELTDRGVFRRFGPVLNPPVIGSSTLAAVRAPTDRFEEVAAAINRHPQVNHNYRRAHEFSMWFVVTAGSRERRDAILAEIEAETGLAVLRLPMLTDYYIDLEFPVVNGDGLAGTTATAGGASSGDGAGSPGPAVDGSASGRRASDAGRVTPTPVDEAAAVDLSAFEAGLLVAVQSGLPLSRTPYADVGAELDASATEVCEALASLSARNCVKRVGCVVDHHYTGFDANCMVVWDVPDAALDDRGAVVGGLPHVTLCYHRPRRPERDWPYNLFTMVHGRDRDRVDAAIDDLAGRALPYDHERLYSTETLKQTGAQYERLVPSSAVPGD